MLAILQDPECYRLLQEHRGPGYIRTSASPGYVGSPSVPEQQSTPVPLEPEPVLESETDREDRLFRERVARFVTGGAESQAVRR